MRILLNISNEFFLENYITFVVKWKLYCYKFEKSVYKCITIYSQRIHFTNLKRYKSKTKYILKLS